MGREAGPGAGSQRTTWNLLASLVTSLDNTDNLQKKAPLAQKLCQAPNPGHKDPKEDLLGTRDALEANVAPATRCTSRSATGCVSHRGAWRPDIMAAAALPPSKSHAHFSWAQPQPGTTQGWGFRSTRLPELRNTSTQYQALLCQYLAG